MDNFFAIRKPWGNNITNTVEFVKHGDIIRLCN